MQAWVLLCKATLAAEFPGFNVINAFSAFRLPIGTKPSKPFTSQLEEKIERLALIFNKPAFPRQFKYFWHHAWVSFKSANFSCTFWVAWRNGIDRGGGPQHGVQDLLYVVKRGQVYCPITSGVEQNFSKIAEIFGSSRLNAMDATEDRNVNLLLASLNDGQLEDLLTRAQKIWKECFLRHAREHVIDRTWIPETTQP